MNKANATPSSKACVASKLSLRTLIFFFCFFFQWLNILIFSLRASPSLEDWELPRAWRTSLLFTQRVRGGEGGREGTSWARAAQLPLVWRQGSRAGSPWENSASDELHPSHPYACPGKALGRAQLWFAPQIFLFLQKDQTTSTEIMIFSTRVLPEQSPNCQKCVPGCCTKNDLPFLSYRWGTAPLKNIFNIFT